MRWDERYARRARLMSGSAIRELLKLTEQPDFISFAGGLPAPESFPVAEIAAATGAILRDRGPQALQYGATEGYRPLRERIARRTSTAAHVVSVENVLITSGSQQALDLLGKVFLDAGDRVLLESPTYLAALQAWNAYEAAYLELPMDEAGLDPTALEPALRQFPKFLYCVPNFQNPTGVTLSLERRLRLVALAAAHGVPLVEDDPYRALRFEGELLPSLLTIVGTAGGVIRLGTFSKTLAPGLRVGWVVAPAEVIGRLALAKQGTDLHTGTLDQYIVHEMLAGGQIEARLPRSSRATGTAGIRCWRHWRSTSRQLCIGHAPPAGCSSGRRCRSGSMRPTCFRRRSSAGWRLSPASRSSPTAAVRIRCDSTSPNAAPERIREGIARLGSLLREY